MNATHTPGKWTAGPWYVRPSSTGLVNRQVCDADGKMVATINSTCNDSANREANARLIAASPMLYEYVKERASLGDKKALDLLKTLALS
jgi:hypothetical protein